MIHRIAEKIIAIVTTEPRDQWETLITEVLREFLSAVTKPAPLRDPLDDE